MATQTVCLLALLVSCGAYVTLDPAVACERWQLGHFAIVIDVRTIAEYEQDGPDSYEGHIQGAYLVDSLGAVGASAITDELLPCRDCAVAVYCRTGVRSKAAAEVLEGAGFTDVYDLQGVTQWSDAGCPLVQGDWVPPSDPPCTGVCPTHAPAPPSPPPSPSPLPSLPPPPSPPPPSSPPPHVCDCEVYEIAGAEEVQPIAMGRFAHDPTAYAPGGRPVYRHEVTGVYLFYWAPQFDWHIGMSVCAETDPLCDGLLAHGSVDRHSLCPSSARSTWVVWTGYGWAHAPSLSIACPSPPPRPPQAPPPPGPPPSPGAPPPQSPGAPAVSVVTALGVTVGALCLLVGLLCVRLRWHSKQRSAERSAAAPAAGSVAVAVPLATVTNVLAAEAGGSFDVRAPPSAAAVGGAPVVGTAVAPRASPGGAPGAPAQTELAAQPAGGARLARLPDRDGGARTTSRTPGPDEHGGAGFV